MHDVDSDYYGCIPVEQIKGFKNKNQMRSNYSLIEPSTIVIYCHIYWLNYLCKLVAHADNIQYSDGYLCKCLSLMISLPKCMRQFTNSRHTNTLLNFEQLLQ